MIDLRSDTVTKPTQQMREAMCNAEVGDDVYNEDPTVNELEKRVANIFHKESAIFFPSGTMSNLTALLTWCNVRGSEVIMGDKSHMFLYEQAGASQFGGISPRTVPNLPDGTMDIENIRNSIRDNDIHEPISKLICIENTHNACGGKVLPLMYLSHLKHLAKEYKIPIHMDGARIWNAIVEIDREPHEISKYVDSLSVCLSKGLGAPVGSLLVGSHYFITKARRIRKALGGGMRQVGILAAAGIQSLDDFESGLLKDDHIRAKKIENEIKNIESFHCRKVDTNIIFLDILHYNKEWYSGDISSNISLMFKQRGILVSVWSPLLLRMVIHRDINDNNIDYIIQNIKEISSILLTENGSNHS